MNYTAWLDKNQMIKPQADWSDSGNGLYYTAMLFAMKELAGEPLDQADRLVWTTAVKKCMDEEGKLFRTPDHQFGNESHDNILGLTVGCKLFDQKVPLRTLLTHLAKTNFVLNTDGNFEASDFMGRFPHIMLALHEAAYPTMSPVVFKWLSFAANQMKATPENPSGHHLTFMYLFSILDVGAGVSSDLVHAVFEDLPKTTEAYFSKDHPIHIYATLIKKS